VPGDPYLLYKITHTDGTAELYEQELTVNETGREITQNILLQTVTKQGSYAVETYIYRKNYLLFIDKDISKRYYTSFYSGTTTQFTDTAYGREQGSISQLIEASYGDIQCEWNILSPDFDCLLMYLYRTFVPSSDAVASTTSETIRTLMATPPWGYVTWPLYILLHPTSTPTTTLQLTLTGLANTPLSEANLTLDVTEGIDKFNDTLSGQSTTYDGTYSEQLIFWWEMAWWLIFSFWVMGKVLNIAHLLTNRNVQYVEKQTNEGKRVKNRSFLATGFRDV